MSNIEVFLIAAQTLDGFIGRDKEDSSLNWRSKADGRFFIEKTKQAGAVVMGSTTFATMRRPMPGRKHYVLTSNPDKFVEYDASVVVAINGSAHEVVKKAVSDGYSQLAVCGGGSVYTQFLKSGLVDRVYLTIEPVFFGEGIKLFDQPILEHLHLEQVINLTEQTIVLDLVRN